MEAGTRCSSSSSSILYTTKYFVFPLFFNYICLKMSTGELNQGLKMTRWTNDDFKTSVQTKVDEGLASKLENFCSNLCEVYSKLMAKITADGEIGKSWGFLQTFPASPSSDICTVLPASKTSSVPVSVRLTVSVVGGTDACSSSTNSLTNVSLKL